MQRLAILLLALVSFELCLAKDRKAEFDDFKKNNGKKYKDAQEEEKRKKQYTANADLIDAHNQEAKAGKKSYTLQINEFADLTPDELKQLNGLKAPQNFDPSKADQSGTISRAKRAVPTSMDWRTSALTPIKNQGQCGSCWAFSATSVLEAYNYIKTKKLVALSEQNMVDCVGTNNYCYGCGGGWPTGAVNYVKNNTNRLDTQASYAYTSGSTTKAGACKFLAANNGFNSTILGVTSVKSLDEVALMTVIGSIGPTMAVVDASSAQFQFYGGGIFNPTTCGNTMSAMNHAVTIVGYGTNATAGGNFWIVRNSWGTTWGEKGYMRIARGKNTCGIALSNQYPLLK